MNPKKVNRFWQHPGRSDQASGVEPYFALIHFATKYGEFTSLEIRYGKQQTVDVYNVLDAWVGTFRSFNQALAYCST
jgi:hypothetical protein